jgi:hypothetical protein
LIDRLEEHFLAFVSLLWLRECARRNAGSLSGHADAWSARQCVSVVHKIAYNSLVEEQLAQQSAHDGTQEEGGAGQSNVRSCIY